MQHVGSSCTRDQTYVFCLGRWIPQPLRHQETILVILKKYHLETMNTPKRYIFQTFLVIEKCTKLTVYPIMDHSLVMSEGACITR